MLNRIINSAIKGRSQYKLDEIVGNSSRYVYTDAHQNAIEVLESLNTVIIKGAPGVGKTTLADQLCQQHVANGYELVFIENSLNEAEQVYELHKPQLFYFDDFLGRNYLQAITKHEDSHIVNFIRRVAKDSTKRFILTTRSNILNQGRQLTDLFHINKLNKNEFEVSVSNLSNLEKAKILYNHIWFGNLDNLYIDQIYKNKRYQAIIEHRNFNPRLISFITDYERLEGIDASEYWNHIERLLNNPEDIWEKVLQKDIDDISRHLIIGMVLHGGSINERLLEQFFENIQSIGLAVNNNKTFLQVIRLLTGALINRTISKDEEISYDLFNPSIGDYVIRNYFKDANYLNAILSALTTTKALRNIQSLLNSESVSNQVLVKLVSLQLTSISEQSYTYPLTIYQVNLILLSKRLTSLSLTSLQKSFLQNVANSLIFDELEKFNANMFNMADYFFELDLIDLQNEEVFDIAHNWLTSAGGEDEFKPLSNIIAKLEPEGGDLTEDLKRYIVEELCENITNDVIEQGILDDMYDTDYLVGSKIDKYVDYTLNEFAVQFDPSDISSIAGSCALEDVIQHNIEVSVGYENDWEGERFFEDYYDESISESGVIDDLFDRG
ncbi:hypothetical protein [Alteromonas sp. PRIM-21]|uniref:nSTAND3 domain-containing NTPase n=1 Tax=Alteromonas sp. PRIM-21 TaxID=1454978 RepID=UPI0022B9BB7A|nr:hypothetical protein [Alteromonas sp. PRIM-21]MCZ8529907.1 hypothetical protein [Alteromonas sp. PRIM-21]